MRTLKPHVMSIMTSNDVDLMNRRKEAYQTYTQARLAYKEIDTEYKTRVKELEALFDPGTSKVYDFIGGFTPEYLDTTPTTKVLADVRAYTGINITAARFGRTMVDENFKRTTRRKPGTKNGVIRVWRNTEA